MFAIRRPYAPEIRPRQRIIRYVQSAGVMAILACSALTGWTVNPWGLVLILVGTIISWITIRANPHAGIAIVRPPEIIQDGPYALIRHPMYFGALVTIAGVAVASQSIWVGAIVLLITLPVTILRLLDEERAFGHSQARWRLVPFVF